MTRCDSGCSAAEDNSGYDDELCRGVVQKSLERHKIVHKAPPIVTQLSDCETVEGEIGEGSSRENAGDCATADEGGRHGGGHRSRRAGQEGS